MKKNNFVPPTFSDKISIALKHFYDIIEDKGERVGVSEGKKHMSWYISGMKGAAQARTEIMNSESFEKIESILINLLNEQ